jgi:hypothetical protein
MVPTFRRFRLSRRVVIGLISSLLVILGLGILFAIERPLWVSIHTPQLEYVLGSPVPIELTVRNLSPVFVPINRCLAWNKTDFFVSQDGQPYRKFSFPEVWQMSSGPDRLAPLLSWHYRFLLLLPFEIYHDERVKPPLIFDQPGLYRVFFSISLPEEHPRVFKSAPLTFRIVPPQGRDAELWKRLCQHDLLLFLDGKLKTRHGWWWDDIEQKARAILKEYPDSAYQDGLTAALKQSGDPEMTLWPFEWEWRGQFP